MFVTQAVFGSGPLHPKDIPSVDITLSQTLGHVGFAIFSLSIGLLVGYRLVILFGFLLMGLWPTMVQLSILYDSDALRNIGMLSRWLIDCVLSGFIYVALYYFKDLGKKKIIKFCIIEAVVCAFANMVILKLVPSNRLPWLFSIYFWAMLVLLYYTVPDTPQWLEDVSVLRLFPHIAGFVGYMLTAFIWLQYRGSFQSWPPFVLFLVICVAMGIFSLGVLILGYPQNWKKERSARLKRQGEMNSWFLIE